MYLLLKNYLESLHHNLSRPFKSLHSQLMDPPLDPQQDQMLVVSHQLWMNLHLKNYLESLHHNLSRPFKSLHSQLMDPPLDQLLRLNQLRLFDCTFHVFQ
jgi:hypothetical protein